MEFKGWTGMRSAGSTGTMVMATNCWWKLADRLFLFCLFHIHHLISIGKNSSFAAHSQSCSCNTLTQTQARHWWHSLPSTLLPTVTFLPACDADHPQTPKLSIPKPSSFESCCSLTSLRAKPPKTPQGATGRPRAPQKAQDVPRYSS